MYNWNQFRNFPKFSNMSAQEQARQYFLYQSNIMMEQSSNSSLAPAAAAAAAAGAGAGGGGKLPEISDISLSKRAIRKEYVTKELDFMHDARYAPTLAELNTEPTFSETATSSEDYASYYRELRDLYYRIQHEKHLWEALNRKDAFFPKNYSTNMGTATFTKMPEFPVHNMLGYTLDADGYVMTVYPNDTGSLFNKSPLQKLSVAWYLPIDEVYDGGEDTSRNNNGWGYEDTNFPGYPEAQAAFDVAIAQKANYYNFLKKQIGRISGFTYYPVGYPADPEVQIEAYQNVPMELSQQEIEWMAIAKTYVVDFYTNAAWHDSYWKYQTTSSEPNLAADKLMPGVKDIRWITSVSTSSELPLSGEFGDAILIEDSGVKAAWNGTEFTELFFQTYFEGAYSRRTSTRDVKLGGYAPIDELTLAIKPFVWAANYLPLSKVSTL